MTKNEKDERRADAWRVPFVARCLEECNNMGLEVEVETLACHSKVDVFQLSCRAESIQAHHWIYIPEERAWSEHPYASDEMVLLCLDANGLCRLRLTEDAETASATQMRQPRELAEYLQYIRNAGALVQSAPGWTARPINDLLTEVGVTLRIDGHEMVLPLTDGTLPIRLSSEVESDLLQVMFESGRHKERMAELFVDKFADYLRPFCHFAGYNGFVWQDGKLEPIDKEAKPGGIYIEPNAGSLSTLYAQEYFSSACIENAEAIRQAFKQVDSLDLFLSRLGDYSMILPSRVEQQTRVALEMRKVCDYVEYEIGELLSEPTRARSMTESKLRILEHLFEMRGKLCAEGA